MPVEVVMPRLGWDMKVGRLAEWLKRDGDSVDVGEVICTVEGDKATSELESMDSGVLHIPPSSPPPGEEVPVGTLLAYLVQPGEAPPAAPLAATPAVAEPESPATPEPGVAGGARPAEAAPRTGPRHVASPRARRAAADLGVDLGVDVAAVTGTGRTGRILERDVRAAAAARTASPPPAASPEGRPAPTSGVRRVTAARMAESAHTTAPVTLTTVADATALVRLRDEIRADLAATGADTPVPTYNDALARLVALALTEHPRLNASLLDGRVVQHDSVHIGLAVDADRGLLVPVVRDVQRKSVQHVAREFARLTRQAKEGTIAADDLTGGTFTITNLGMYDVDAFTPIVNLPECAILGVGRILARPVVVDEVTEQVAVRKMMALSLTFDHRVVDGAPAARFLRRVKQFVEHPGAWLTR